MRAKPGQTSPPNLASSRNESDSPRHLDRALARHDPESMKQVADDSARTRPKRHQDFTGAGIRSVRGRCPLSGKQQVQSRSRLTRTFLDNWRAQRGPIINRQGMGLARLWALTRER